MLCYDKSYILFLTPSKKISFYATGKNNPLKIKESWAISIISGGRIKENNLRNFTKYHAIGNTFAPNK